VFVGIATGYGLDGPVFIPSRVDIFLFSTASILALRSAQPSVQLVLGILPLGVKSPEHEVDHSSLSSAEVKKGGSIPPFSHTSSWPSA
jgi:hypothetical protein